MSEVTQKAEINQETLERLVITTKQLLAALPVVAAAASNADSSTSLINMSEIVGYGDTSDPTISCITEIMSYEPVYLIKTNDYIIGGANGIANLQAQALVGRDNYLKRLIETLAKRIDELDIAPGTTADERYAEIVRRLNALNISVFDRQISQLERQNMINALALKIAGMDADDNGMIIEVFQNGTTISIDQTNAEVVSVIPGDDSVDITDAKNLIKGGIYQLTDGETSEEVQIKENLGAIENGYRILFEADVTKTYKNGRARLYRSSAEIVEGRAYGGGISCEKTWNADIDFIGASGEATLSATLDFSNGLGFELDGAVVDADGQIVLGEEAIGVALTPTGWVRVNAEGDDLDV